MYGNNIYVDITIVVNGEMSVQTSHDLTEEVEELLFKQFDVMHTDVHVEPLSMHKIYTLPHLVLVITSVTE